MSLIIRRIITGQSSSAIRWAKVHFYYAHTLSSLAATSTASGYDVANLLNRLELNGWKATSTATQYITFDAGLGNTYAADYVAISGHNLFTADSLISVEYSDDNFVADVNAAFTPETPGDNLEYVKEFTEFDERYSRIKIESNSVAPEIAIGYWGPKTELDYASTSYDPNSMEDKAIVNVSDTGFVMGIHERFVERRFNLSFRDAELSLYAKLKTWFEAIGQENFFVAFDPTNHSDDVFLMRSGKKFTNPFVRGGLYRNININLVGRMQE
jgi:hypothetical protein